MKKALVVIALLLTLGIPALAQTINPNITVAAASGAPNCTPGQLCRARGFNFLLGYPAGFGWANGAKVDVYAVMPDGSLKLSLQSIPNIDRIDFYPPLGSEGAVAYRFVSRFYNIQTAPLTTPTPTFSPTLFARGTFCYTRPAPGSCQPFNGSLTIPPHVGLVSIIIEAGGLGAFSSDWTLVLSDGPNDEQSSFGLEFAATGFPASSAIYTDQIHATIGRPAAGTYFLWVYKPVAGGTITRSASISLPIQ